MCEFCAQHGDGKKWYLQAENYAVDLSRDIERQEYMLDFVWEFDKRMKRNIPLLKMFAAAPKPIKAAFRSYAQPRQIRDHFGQPVPIEECEQVFELATSIVQLPCVCRHFAGAPERGYCIAMTVTPQDAVYEEAFRDFAEGPDTAKLQRLTKDEAMGILRRAETEGLMHSVWTFKTPFIAAICNCDLSSGCMAMKTTLTYDYKTMWKGEYRAAVDESACTGCGACEDRCPFDAVAVDHRSIAAVDAEACYGCGICRSACPTEALTLKDRAAGGVLAW